jgi:hypothetical protein
MELAIKAQHIYNPSKDKKTKTKTKTKMMMRDGVRVPPSKVNVSQCSRKLVEAGEIREFPN